MATPQIRSPDLRPARLLRPIGTLCPGGGELFRVLIVKAGTHSGKTHLYRAEGGARTELLNFEPSK